MKNKYKITTYSRSSGKPRRLYFLTLEAATKVANEHFAQTGIVLGIEAVRR